MNDEDVALFRQAEALANSGRVLVAHDMFCELRDRGNQEIEILFWIVQTTPDVVESRQTLDTIKRLQPDHPLIHRTKAFHNRKLQTAHTPPVPVLICPYCGIRATARIKSRMSVAGWVWFSAFFLLTLGCLFALVPIAQVAAMGKAAWFFLFIGAIGFFFRKKRYVCGHCGIGLGQ